MENAVSIQPLAVRDDHQPPRLDAPAAGADMAALSNSLTRSSPTGRFRNWRMLRRVWRTSKASIERSFIGFVFVAPYQNRFAAPEPICRAPSVKMPCSPHGCLDILFRRVRACHCVIMRVYSFRSGQRNEGFVPAVFVPRTYFVCWLFLHSFRDSVF